LKGEEMDNISDYMSLSFSGTLISDPVPIGENETKLLVGIHQKQKIKLEVFVKQSVQDLECIKRDKLIIANAFLFQKKNGQFAAALRPNISTLEIIRRPNCLPTRNVDDVL
jgi:hypothetical protein